MYRPTVSSPSASAINSEQQVQVTDTDAKKQSTEAMDIEADEAKTTTTVVVIEKTPEEIARENLKKAEKDLKESIQDLEKKEQMIHAEMEADDLGALVFFAGANVRYITGSYQGNWK